MSSPSTLNELLRKHPEYGDLPVVVAREDGYLDYLSGSAMVYPSYDEDEKIEILVFSGN